MSSLTFKQDTYILNNVKNILKIPHQDSNGGGKGRWGGGEVMFHEMDGSVSQRCAQFPSMEHPRGSGAESLMSSDRARAWRGPGMAVLHEGWQRGALGYLAFCLSFQFRICNRNRRRRNSLRRL